MTPPIATRILLVEDDTDIADVLRRGLRLAGYSVAVASDGREAQVELEVAPPHLLLLDVMLPDGSGVDLCRRIRSVEAAERRQHLPILMLSARGGVPDRVTGLTNGADDFLAKPFAFEELLARIQALLRRSRAEGNVAESDDVLVYSGVALNPRARTVVRGDRELHLSAREFDVLELMLRHPNQVMTRSQLMARFWPEYHGDSNVLEVLIASLRHAMEVHDEPRLIQTVRGVGYVLRSAA